MADCFHSHRQSLALIHNLSAYGFKLKACVGVSILKCKLSNRLPQCGGFNSRRGWVQTARIVFATDSSRLVIRILLPCAAPMSGVRRLSQLSQSKDSTSQTSLRTSRKFLLTRLSLGWRWSRSRLSSFVGLQPIAARIDLVTSRRRNSVETQTHAFKLKCSFT